MRLISEDLERFSETPTFSPRLNVFIGQIKTAIDKLVDQQDVVPENVSRFLVGQFASLIKFLSGSSSKRIPYEIAYSLEQALKDWQAKPAIVSTALSPDLMSGFYFQGVNENFYTALDNFLSVSVDERLVQISLPEVYRHCPIFCVPLYHELGHYIDIELGITTSWLLSTPIEDLPLADVSSDPRLENVHRHHRMEYFADLFAASYVGNAVDDFLIQFTGGTQVSPTHPSTAARSAVVQDFLGHKNGHILTSLQSILEGLGLPKLTARFTEVDLSCSFDNMRPATLTSLEELHGVFLSAWKYLGEQSTNPSGWAAAMRQNEIERLVNNLVEKTIRNYMIREKWEA